MSSTTDAARLAQTEQNAAAVASRQAAVRYGIRVVYHNIEDSPFNETRFAVIGASDSARTGRDKTAIMFQVSHTPGALADVLGIFKANKINLTWMESFPYKDAKGEYVFFVDFEGHREDAEGEEGPRPRWRPAATSISVLGSFPLAQAADE